MICESLNLFYGCDFLCVPVWCLMCALFRFSLHFFLGRPDQVFGSGRFYLTQAGL